MKVLILILTSLYSLNSFSNHRLETDFYIIKYASEYGLNPKLFRAVLRVESNLNFKAVNKRTKDYGIAQINVRTHKVDKERLLNDLDYSVKKGAEILSWFKKTYKKKLGKKWVARYNCGTSYKCEEWRSSKKYIKKIYLAME